MRLLSAITMSPVQWAPVEVKGYQTREPYQNWLFHCHRYRISLFVSMNFIRPCFVENFFANRDPYAIKIKQKIYEQGIDVRNTSQRIRPIIHWRKKQLE